MIDLASRMCSLPGGLKTFVGELLDQELERNACWRESETAVAEGRRPISVYPAWMRKGSLMATLTPRAAQLRKHPWMRDQRLKASYPIRLVTTENNLEITRRVSRLRPGQKYYLP
jgi:hypothetical protein